MSVTPIFQNGGFGLKRECSSHPNHQSIAWLLLVIIDLFFIQMSISIIKYQVKALNLQKSFNVLSLKIFLCYLFGGLYGQQNAFLQSNYKDSNFFIIFSKYSNAHLICFWKKLPKECPGFVRHEHFVLASFRYL